MSVAVEIIFKYLSIEPVVIWEHLIKSQPDTLLQNEQGTLYDRKVNFLDIETAIKKLGKPHFHVEFKNAVYQYGAIGNHKISVISIENCIINLDDACRWTEPFLSFDSIVQARVYDKEYEYWQNASDPLEYETAGRSYSHLPTRSNDLPPPLEQMIIDTSKNPGRRLLREGYIEAIGSVMWLGKLFWEITGKKKESILKENWLECVQVLPEVICLKAQESLFKTDNGRDREIQDRLRLLLFSV